MSAAKRFSPVFLKIIDESARQCFGHLPVVNYRTGLKYLRQKPVGPLAADYYIPDLTRAFRNYTDDFNTEEEERRADKLNRLKRRGKGPPPKGQGRRASRRK